MDALRAGIMEFILGLLTAFLNLTQGGEPTEEHIEGIKNFVNAIFMM